MILLGLKTIKTSTRKTMLVQVACLLVVSFSILTVWKFHANLLTYSEDPTQFFHIFLETQIQADAKRISQSLNFSIGDTLSISSPSNPSPINHTNSNNESTSYISSPIIHNNINNETFDLRNYNAKIERMWNCTGMNHRRQKKLIFIHIFKTAGSTFRNLFDKYASRCQASNAVLSDCSLLKAESTWDINETWEPCKMKRGKIRTGGSFLNRKNVTGVFLRDNIDILIGHLPIGVHNYWPIDKSIYDGQDDGLKSVVNVQYVAFFRAVIPKYVSGVIHNIEQGTLPGMVPRLKKQRFEKEEVVAFIKKEVQSGLSNGVYGQGYSPYLLSPEQKRMNLTIEHRINLVLSNIIDYKVIVGIVEHMDESLEILKYVIDGVDEFSDVFDRLDTQKNISSDSTTHLVLNKSLMPIDIVINELCKDKVFYRQLNEFLKYDAKIYDFALQVQERQYKSLLDKDSIQRSSSKLSTT